MDAAHQNFKFRDADFLEQEFGKLSLLEAEPSTFAALTDALYEAGIPMMVHHQSSTIYVFFHFLSQAQSIQTAFKSPHAV
ncbi:hypothetical protein [Deinococcus cellulosilyticus]|uniref:Uncharacterized protein n=1 Tax=Deinococcus cellulosilyticus (strain DSM 18568 / NBRC 106333 / KACC 11606 / 5516J-15) TaxID=1223518 RepID=A0A511NAH5_DEIC1|nr:hypothetical protein [Deinococcus cellulosilyticus]GEM49834.1 hypothetical protein DC3_54690 [Deinococcus cellulosilyticus NBRC 106333 = KACC 11606]